MAAAGYQVRAGALTADPVLVMVRGNLVVGKLADLQVADRKAAFTVTVQSASAGASGGYALLAAGGFQALISRP